MSMLYQLTNSPVSENILLFCPSAPCIRPGKRQTTAFDGTPSSEGLADGVAVRFGKTGQSDTLDIASLNVKNVKTNLSFVKSL